jgi:hypothetical protein
MRQFAGCSGVADRRLGYHTSGSEMVRPSCRADEQDLLGKPHVPHTLARQPLRSLYPKPRGAPQDRRRSGAKCGDGIRRAHRSARSSGSSSPISRRPPGDTVSVSATQLFADGPELALLELTDRDPAPAIRGADHRRVHQLEHGPLAQGLRDDLGAPPLLEEQPLEEIGRPDDLAVAEREAEMSNARHIVRETATLRRLREKRTGDPLKLKSSGPPRESDFGLDGESWLQRLWPREDQGGGEREELRLHGVQRLHEGQTWNPADRLSRRRNERHPVARDAAGGVGGVEEGRDPKSTRPCAWPGATPRRSPTSGVHD